MISHPHTVVGYTLLLIGMFACIFALVRYIRWRIHPPVVQEPETFDLGDPAVRQRLAKMLETYNITGEADIREGKVYAAPNWDRMHPLLGIVNSANMALQRLKNPAASSLYIRDSVNDRFMLVPELDIDDLREISELLRAAVAERMRSKSIGN